MTLKQAQLKHFAEFSCNKIASARPGVEFFEMPFKHLVIDNFFPDEIAESCLKNFPEVNSKGWQYTDDKDIEIKYRTTWKSEFDIPDGIIDAVRIMNSSVFLLAVSNVLGIPKIIPDPYFTGGGLNVTLQDGLLDVHVDGNYHDATGLNRRINALLYLNPKWQNDWGGEFGLYDETGSECLKKIAPLHNRLVIFDSHDKSFHGLPDPINFPQSDPRRSIILYYYTKEERPKDQVIVSNPHSALWKKRNLLDKRGKRTRNFS